MTVRRLDPQQPRAIADRDAEELSEPAQILGPVGAQNAFDRRVGFGTMTRLVPSLEAEGGIADLGTAKLFGVRSRFIRAAVSHTPALASSSAASMTETLPIPARRSANENALPV